MTTTRPEPRLQSSTRRRRRRRMVARERADSEPTTSASRPAGRSPHPHGTSHVSCSRLSPPWTAGEPRRAGAATGGHHASRPARRDAIRRERSPRSACPTGPPSNRPSRGALEAFGHPLGVRFGPPAIQSGACGCSTTSARSMAAGACAPLNWRRLTPLGLPNTGISTVPGPPR